MRWGYTIDTYIFYVVQLPKFIDVLVVDYTEATVVHRAFDVT